MGSRAKDLTKSSEQEKEILDCVRKGNIERVKSLLDEGTPFNYSYYWNCFAGSSPLDDACYHGHIEIVSLLLERGADPYLHNHLGWTSIHYASNKGHHLVVSILLDRGVDPNIQQIDTPAPLLLASGAGHKSVISLLLDRGADPNIQSKSGDTPLHYAIRSGNESLVSLLLERGANPNLHNKIGRTPLREAVCRNQDVLVFLLLKSGANPYHGLMEGGEKSLVLANEEMDGSNTSLSDLRIANLKLTQEVKMLKAQLESRNSLPCQIVDSSRLPHENEELMNSPSH